MKKMKIRGEKIQRRLLTNEITQFWGPKMLHPGHLLPAPSPLQDPDSQIFDEDAHLFTARVAHFAVVKILTSFGRFQRHCLVVPSCLTCHWIFQTFPNFYIGVLNI